MQTHIQFDNAEGKSPVVSSDNPLPVSVDALTLEGGDIVIGTIEIKDGVSADKVSVTSDGELTTKTIFPSTATVTKVASSASNVTLKVSNVARKGLTIQNDSTANLYVKFGTTASITNSYTVKIPAGGFYEIAQPCYTGRVDGIWDSADGSAFVTEMT